MPSHSPTSPTIMKSFEATRDLPLAVPSTGERRVTAQVRRRLGLVLFLSFSGVTVPGVAGAYVENPLFDQIDPSRGPAPFETWDFTVTYLKAVGALDWSNRGVLTGMPACSGAWEFSSGAFPSITSDVVLKYYVSSSPAALRVVEQNATGYHYRDASCATASPGPAPNPALTLRSESAHAVPAAQPATTRAAWTDEITTGKVLVFTGSDPNAARSYSRVVNHQSARFQTTAYGFASVADAPFTGVLVGQMPGLAFTTNAYLAGVPWDIGFDVGPSTTGTRVYDPTRILEIMMFAAPFHLAPGLIGPPAGTYQAAFQVCDACE